MHPEMQHSLIFLTGILSLRELQGCCECRTLKLQGPIK